MRATALEAGRVARGWAPFWRYLELGRYGEQLAHLYRHVDPARVHVIRYRELIDEPARTLDGIAAFLGVGTGLVDAIPPSNTHRWAPDSAVNTVLRGVVRSGAAVGGLLPPRVWRRAERPLLRALQRENAPRPRLAPQARRALLPAVRDDVELLENLLGRSFHDWVSDEVRGAFRDRTAQPPVRAQGDETG